MKKSKAIQADSDRDTLRPEYDFSTGRRGITAARYADGANVVVIDPDLLDVFPDGASINQTLRALAPMLRERLARTKPNKRLQPARAIPRGHRTRRRARG